MTATTIDPEKAIIAALEHYLPDLVDQGTPRIYSQPPRDWHLHDFIVVRATGGGASRTHLWQVCYFEIEAFSAQRGDASLLARRAASAMSQASRDGFRYEPPGIPGGYLFGFREVNAPSLVYDGLSSKHGDTYMFQGTYQVSIRPLR